MSHPPSDVALLDVLALEQLDRDLHRSRVLLEEPHPLYGGQVFAQALLAAAASVPQGRLPHSAHGYFLRPGDSGRPVVFAVERDRDGRSFSARRVVARQHGEVILNLSASFHEAEADAPDEAGIPVPVAPGTLEVSRPHRLVGVEQRLVHQPHVTWPTQAWMRCLEPMPDDPALHAAVLAYLSDMNTGLGSLASSRHRDLSTLDHTVWFHRPVRADLWMLMDLQARAVSEGRGLYTGAIWTEDGVLAASLAQESLYRLRKG
ncbi:MAG: Choloyl-CoA hydrolase [Frankiales bacterium]|nr:Choloyl-CoA hydrolase [Frankiales bacterium]